MAIQKLFIFGVLLILSACAGTVEKEARYPTGGQRDGLDANAIYTDRDSVFGEDGLNIFGGDKDKGTSADSITVNSYLWRASLDTISFMPLANVDPFGGVILTDWYSDPAAPDERYKLNVFVTGSQLRSDAIRVSAFQQKRNGGNWNDIPVDPLIATQIEDAILTRARQIRVASK
jgi:hypothetical protein